VDHRAATFRSLTPEDAPLLRAATLANMNWCGERFVEAEIDTNPHFARYCRLELDRGDFGFVAQGPQGPVGVVWLRFLPADEPGYGFVRAGIPELSLNVVAVHRGAGIGSRLLDAVIDEARRRGLAAISLSVESGNDARTLYERCGFAAAHVPDDGTLVLELGAARGTTSSGERDLQVLLATMSPELRPGRFVFATTAEIPPGCTPVVVVREDEGVTVVLPQEEADRLGLGYDYVAAMITLRVHSALDAVGLTAVVAQRLATAGLSCNVVAGYHHDHLFVPAERAEEAVDLLGAFAHPSTGRVAADAREQPCIDES
jgi:GNAT superfamily N-acetyltransferase